MRREDYDRFAMVLTATAELYGKTLSAGAITLWWQALERFSLEQVGKALRQHTEDAERGQFMPKPADLIRALEGTATDKAALAWGKVLDATSRVGAYTDVVFDDPAIHAVVADMGGWPKVCRTETSELGYLQHRFCEAYRAYAGRPTFDYPRLLGGDRSPDEMYMRRGLPAPKPAVVGDVVTARIVYQRGTKGQISITDVADLAVQAIGHDKAQA
jgi:hypothetical protein